MKAMIIRNYGGSDVFEPTEISKPEVKPGHVLVKIDATSINTVDTMIREMGKALPISPELPAVLGMDFAGTVESVGEGIFEFAVGDEVYGCAGGLGDLPGTLAEYMVADANLIAHQPKTLTMREAAALPLVGITAYEGLTRAGVAQGPVHISHRRERAGPKNRISFEDPGQDHRDISGMFENRPLCWFERSEAKIGR